ncbi:hypothetical protein Q9Q95_01370 [Sphingomonas sp. DG1-23]|uniref:hypothetical protein n=1 Tax=Sphingomonas sp. DG1-23 TaxID=3068316 RepID=UPI00273D0953|nr:hypothetical protein [Sphingomonas sp. DG1-23]MDP5277557.1 hypothetical protein [Sphingomonas sp. DG1-23]
MFDSIGAFNKQFVPVEGGYLYYPSKNGGGKLVTADEYKQLTEDWRKIAGRRGVWTVAGIVTLAIIVWTIISRSLSLPDWSDSIIIGACVLGISAWLFWAGFAPHRLVRDRPAIVPPRPASEARRQARAMVNWPFVIVGLLLSGIVLIGSLNSPERDFNAWAWLVGSGLIFSLHIWVAIQKLRDR